MDRLATLALFARIVERGSFTAAAADLAVSRPAATAAIRGLEARLGVRLLHRSTRHVQVTAEGEAYYRRCVAILRDLEDADRDAGGSVAGLLRVDMSGNLARTLLMATLPDFLARHPGLVLHLGEGERLVDLVREGVDCVVRAGAPADSDMMGRRLGSMAETTCASPDYLARHGVPTSPDDLDGHVMVGFVSSRTGQVMPLEFTVGSETIEVTLPSRILVNGADTNVAAALRGLGLIQAPRFRFARELAEGTLVEVLPQHPPSPTPVHVLHPGPRRPPPRVRVFIDWLVETLVPLLEAHPDPDRVPAPRPPGS